MIFVLDDHGDQLHEDVLSEVFGLLFVSHDAADVAVHVVGVAHIQQAQRIAQIGSWDLDLDSGCPKLGREVAREALRIETPRIGIADQRRIAAALEQLGWKRLPKDYKGNRWWMKS